MTTQPYVGVEIADGKLRGGRSRSTLAFERIPCGGSVSGSGRFKPAVAVEAWTGVRDALVLGTPAYQSPHTVYGEHEAAPGEECQGTDWTPRAGHATDIASKFENPDIPGLMGTRPDRFQASKNFGEVWTSFARTRRPHAPGIHEWPAYDLTSRSSALIDVHCSLAHDPDKPERELFQGMAGLRGKKIPRNVDPRWSQSTHWQEADTDLEQ
jgi:carboxylesterase type B